MDVNELLPRFQFTKLLNSDQGGRRIILQGTISGSPALLLAERGAFSVEEEHLRTFSSLLSNIQNLGDNDVYKWYLANTRSSSSSSSSNDNAAPPSAPPDLKINLIYPSTDKHIRKYSFQQSRVVLETPKIYTSYIHPYMRLCREEGRLNWVFNILEGRTEQENVLYRSSEQDPQDDFLLLPDLNWDRKTQSSLHLLALVARRDLWSLRDLRKRHVGWLRRLRATLVERVVELYRGVEGDMLKFYVHYQPTYYHFHVHVVHVDLDATGTQAVGKAVGLEGLISTLENLRDVDDDDDDDDDGGDGEGEEAGMQQVELSYTVGEASELWTQIFLPLKEGREPVVKI